MQRDTDDETGQPMAEAKTTQHTCGGPVFGRKTPGCPRCDELQAGAGARARHAPPAEITRHTCCPSGRGPAFGRKTPGCPRCEELLAGAPARQAHGGHIAARRRAAAEEQTSQAIREHRCTDAGCGPVCTAFQW